MKKPSRKNGVSGEIYSFLFFFPKTNEYRGQVEPARLLLSAFCLLLSVFRPLSPVINPPGALPGERHIDDMSRRWLSERSEAETKTPQIFFLRAHSGFFVYFVVDLFPTLCSLFSTLLPVGELFVLQKNNLGQDHNV
jgi:hypothetical protein